MLVDKSLLRAFKKGTKEALRRVYEFYLNDVVTLVRVGFSSGNAHVRAQHDRGEQLDQAHDIFVKAFKEKARNSYDGLRRYKPYLLRIGKNTIIDRLRKEKNTLVLDESNTPQAQTPNLEEDLHFKKLKKATQHFLQAQDDELKRFVVFRFEEGLSQADVAQKMSVTRRRVRTLEERAQKALLDHLKSLGLLNETNANSQKNIADQRPISKGVA